MRASPSTEYSPFPSVRNAERKRAAVPALPIKRSAFFAGIFPPKPFIVILEFSGARLTLKPRVWSELAKYKVSSENSALFIVVMPSAKALISKARLVSDLEPGTLTLDLRELVIGLICSVFVACLGFIIIRSYWISD